jgi:bifunctional lysine-specific demethylase and histidyl-hydroxylase NO66
MNGAETMAWLLSPTSPHVFFDEYWQKKPLHLRRNDPNYYADLLTIDDIERILWTIPLPVTSVDMGKDAVPVQKHEFSNGVYIRPHDVLRHHRNGETLILRSLHRWCDNLQKLRAACESYFYCPAQTNVYLTPAQEHSSYPHFDAHDIFVLQIAGSKCWKLHETCLPLPLHTERFEQSKHPIGPCIGELTLNAGDMAYIPRGFAHDPTAVDYSIHISLGVLLPTWTDVFSEMVRDLSYRHASLREELPVMRGQQCFDMRQIRGRFAALAKLFDDTGAAEDALNKISHEFIKTRQVSEPGKLKEVSQPRDIDLNSEVRIPENLIYRVRRDENKLHLEFREVRLTLDVELDPIIQFIAQRERFKVTDLTDALTDVEKLRLVKDFVDEGFLAACN